MNCRHESDLKKLLFILFLFWIGIFLLCSCGVRKGSVDTYAHNVDSSFTNVKKEQSANTKDSAQEKKVENNTVKETTDSGALHLEFDTTGHVPDDQPITIIIDSTGSLTIKTPGKRLKSLTDTRKRTEKKQEQTKTSDSTHFKTETAAAKSDSSTGHLIEKEKGKQVKKSNWQVPWIVWVIIAIVAILGWFFWPQIKSAKKLKDTIIPYSAPNDKS